MFLPSDDVSGKPAPRSPSPSRRASPYRVLGPAHSYHVHTPSYPPPPIYKLTRMHTHPPRPALPIQSADSGGSKREKKGVSRAAHRPSPRPSLNAEVM